MERFQEPDLADCFPVEVVLRPGNRLEVYFDSDSGVTFSKCKSVSRFLESHLDSESWLGEKYTLDVSSPGIGRPLAFIRQYPRNIGRTVEVTLRNDTKHKGILRDVSAENIIVEEKARIEQNGKKKNVILQTVIPFDNIQSTVVKVVF